MKNLSRRDFLQKSVISALGFSALGSLAGCAVSARDTAAEKCIWDRDTLFKTPKAYEAPEWTAEGVHAVMYEGLPYKGKPTRVFAWYGVPEHNPGEKVPGIVLAHGGGGTAFDEWVRMWNSWGYAAIAMDQRGQVPRKTDQPHQYERHAWAGPPQEGFFADYNEPLRDRWMYHAVADVILAHSFLRSLDGVDPNRIGLTGISWGGIVTSVVVGMDNRLTFAVPVFGCGFLYESGNHYERTYEKMPPEKSLEARRCWDGSNYISKADMPMLWLNGIRDKHFYPPIFQKSCRLAKDHAILCFKPDIGHSHPVGWNNDEIRAFADSVVKGGRKLINVFDQGVGPDDTAWAKYSGPVEPEKVELIYTLDTVDWPERSWQRLPARIHPDENTVSASVPENTRAYYFLVYDDRGLMTSSEVIVNE